MGARTVAGAIRTAPMLKLAGNGNIRPFYLPHQIYLNRARHRPGISYCVKNIKKTEGAESTETAWACAAFVGSGDDMKPVAAFLGGVVVASGIAYMALGGKQE